MSFQSYFVESKEEKEDSVEVNQEFIEKRKAGAAKIANQATVKGGYSSLTAAHFHAKAVPYSNCLKKITKPESVVKIVNDLIKKLDNWESMSQMEFQKVMGQIEAYGEVALQLKKPKEY
jgi:hypothetical protein